MVCVCEAVLYPIGVYALYRLVDWVVRVPFVGGYSQKYIFVTGCDTGFGFELAKRLDKRGCNVFAGCLTEAGETQLRKISSVRLHTFSLDVTKRESVAKALEFVKSKLPPGRGLWGVVNNAGVGGKGGQMEWLVLADYQDTFNINLLGTIDVTMTLLPLVKRERGRVVCMSSAAGRLAMPYLAAYAVSKHGIEAFGEALRRSLRRFKCSVHLIEPGAHNTRMCSKENFATSITATWEQTTPEIKAEFGEQYFKDLVDKVYEDHIKVSTDGLGGVLDAYEHALFSVVPRARYEVGLDAKLLYYPTTWMPEWLSDWILIDLLNANQPTPLSLQKRSSL